MATQSITAPLVKASGRKAALEAKLGELLGAIREHDELRIEYLADSVDRVSSSSDREITVQRLDTITGLIRDVESALLRIQEGSYGFSEQCDSPIQPRRLDVVPWARLCINCQSQAEVATRERKPALKHVV